MLRRHDRYLAVFGDTPPELLELGYGPSQKHSSSECLYAIYYPDDPGLGASGRGRAWILEQT
eukprot:1885422-Prymnesium_polylepis.1